MGRGDIMGEIVVPVADRGLVSSFRVADPGLVSSPVIPA